MVYAATPPWLPLAVINVYRFFPWNCLKLFQTNWIWMMKSYFWYDFVLNHFPFSWRSFSIHEIYTFNFRLSTIQVCTDALKSCVYSLSKIVKCSVQKIGLCVWCEKPKRITWSKKIPISTRECIFPMVCAHPKCHVPILHNRFLWECECELQHNNLNEFKQNTAHPFRICCKPFRSVTYFSAIKVRWWN